MSGSSVDTTVRVMLRDRTACRTLCATSGRPPTTRRFFLGSRLDPPRAGMMQSTSCWLTNATELGPDGQLALVDALGAVAEGLLDRAHVAHETLQADDLDRCRLITAPHRAIERDVAFEHGRAKRDS